MYEEFPVKILDKEYKVMGEIDNGTEGCKKILQHKDNEHSKYLVKILPLKDQKDVERYDKEINIMKKLDHPNIAKMIDFCKEKDQLMVFYPYYAGGSLADLIDDKGRLDEETSRTYFRQLVDAVDFCHQNNIAHRDIKPDNIILDADHKNIVLADFGLCKEMNGLFDDFPGTPLYNSPEKFLGQQYCGIKNDIWCLGITLYEMLTTDTPFYPHKTKTIEEMARNIVYMDPRFPTYISEDAKNLISSLLDKTPNLRPSIEDVRKHPWPHFVLHKANNSNINSISSNHVNLLTSSHESLDHSSSHSNHSDSLSNSGDSDLSSPSPNSNLCDLTSDQPKKSSQQNFIYL